MQFHSVLSLNCVLLNTTAFQQDVKIQAVQFRLYFFLPKRSYLSIIFFVLDKILVGTSSLIAVGWAHHSEVRDETQRWNGLNGLMGRAILSNLSSSRSPTQTKLFTFPVI